MIPRLRLLVIVDNESATPEHETVVASAVGRPGRLSPVQTERAAPGAALRDQHTLPRKPAFEVRARAQPNGSLLCVCHLRIGPMVCATPSATSDSAGGSAPTVVAAGGVSRQLHPRHG